MTPKELLHRKIDDMSEREAELLLDLIADDGADLPPLTAEDRAALERALEQERQGKVIPHEEVLRRFGRA